MGETIVEAVKDIALVAAGAIATFLVTRWSTSTERKHQIELRDDERAYTAQREARAGEIALEREILDRTKRYAMKVLEIDRALRTGDVDQANALMADANPTAFDPDLPHVALIYDPDLRDAFDEVVIDSQRAILDLKAGRDPRRDAAWVGHLTEMGGNLMALFHQQDLRLARSELPARIEDTPERMEKRHRHLQELGDTYAELVSEPTEPTEPAEPARS